MATRRKTIMAIHIHVRVFCIFFAFWREFVPTIIFSTATATCMGNNQIKSTSMHYISTHFTLKKVGLMQHLTFYCRYSHLMQIIELNCTWDSMLSSISPCTSTRTDISRKIYRGNENRWVTHNASLVYQELPKKDQVQSLS